MPSVLRRLIASIRIFETFKCCFFCRGFWTKQTVVHPVCYIFAVVFYLSLINLLGSKLVAQVYPFLDSLLVHAVCVLRHEIVVLRSQSYAHCG